ncbi:MAG: hypothetical protein QM742_02820 [Aquabacterium sp.]
MKKLVMKLGAAAAVLALSGCATIIGDPAQVVPIASTPSEASISIVDERGSEVFKGNTPTTVTLQKSDGTYWGGKTYTVKIAKEGFESQSVVLKATPNGWYLLGNFVFGGLIGWFVVDPLNGDMYTLSPNEIKASMQGAAAKTSQSDFSKDGLKIVLVQDVPADLRAKMVRVN